MPRRRVTRLRKLCDLLAGHSAEQSQRVAEAAIELVRPWLPEGQEVVDLFQFQLAVGKRLDSLRSSLTAIDNRHIHELQNDRNLREERDAATAELRQDMIQLKDGLNGLFGAGGANKIFEEAAVIPPDPVALHQLTGHVRDNLGNADFPMPKPLKKGFNLDREEAVSDLDGPYRRLGDVLRRLQVSASASKFTQSRKDDDVAETGVFANKVARFLEAFYDLVGLDGLSDRVRRSSRRAASDDSGGGEAAAGGEGEPAEPGTGAPAASG